MNCWWCCDSWAHDSGKTYDLRVAPTHTRNTISSTARHKIRLASRDERDRRKHLSTCTHTHNTLLSCRAIATETNFRNTSNDETICFPSNFTVRLWVVDCIQFFSLSFLGSNSIYFYFCFGRFVIVAVETIHSLMHDSCRHKYTSLKVTPIVGSIATS